MVVSFHRHAVRLNDSIHNGRVSLSLWIQINDERIELVMVISFQLLSVITSSLALKSLTAALDYCRTRFDSHRNVSASFIIMKK